MQRFVIKCESCGKELKHMTPCQSCSVINGSYTGKIFISINLVILGLVLGYLYYSCF